MYLDDIVEIAVDMTFVRPTRLGSRDNLGDVSSSIPEARLISNGNVSGDSGRHSGLPSSCKLSPTNLQESANTIEWAASCVVILIVPALA